MGRKLSRRRILQLTGIGAATAAALGAGYSLKRGIRYPSLGLEPTPLKTVFTDLGTSASISSNDVIELPRSAGQPLALRAFSAEPILIIRGSQISRLELSLNNIASEAQLHTISGNAQVKEQTSGITRNLSIDLKRDSELILQWKLPYQSGYKFASIGDSGGDKELRWCIQRAHQLGAKFLLHLGDFNYQPGDYERAVSLFHNSPIPCYVTIGNHDFHENGNIYQQFLDQLGPLNHAFQIGKTRFVNLDTAANTFPYSAGLRGNLVEQLITSNDQVNDTVTYTHRPIHDPMENSSHDIGSTGERDWLINALNSINSPTLLSGHIHIYDRSTFHGIDNIIAGQGMGHQDLITNSSYSKMVVGEVDDNGRTEYHTELLDMPMELHCHPRMNPVKQELMNSKELVEHHKLLRLIDDACAS